ncbi:MAG: DUF362 domain-containing protein [Proteobacteria bacterium]|nr:DUF362 domain-containing protein [Pseudomonadota bacterium]
MKDKDKKRHLTRRAFLGSTTGAALVGASGLSMACGRLRPAPGNAKIKENKEDSTLEQKRSKVVLIRDQNVLDSGRKPNPEILTRMLDDAVAGLLDKPADDAWKELIRPDDVVGIKSNEWQFLSTPKELESAIEKRLLGVGITKDRMSVDDRGARSNPVFKKATALINVRPLRTHHWAGAGTCIKNYIVFSAVPFSWHVDSCANLGGLWELDEVKGKTRLNILVMLTPLFHGKGPHHFHAKYTWPYNGLIVGTDPVAVDATGMRILEAKRKEHFGKSEPLGTPPKHIQVAETRYHIGVADPNRIDVKKIGWAEGMLI